MSFHAGGWPVCHTGYVLEADFYGSCLRMITLECVNSANYKNETMPEAFIEQHGEPLEGLTYIGIAEEYSVMYRFFRVIKQECDYTLTSTGKRSKTLFTYHLAGMYEDACSILDKYVSQSNNKCAN